MMGSSGMRDGDPTRPGFGEASDEGAVMEQGSYTEEEGN
jgi:hypothetical protein